MTSRPWQLSMWFCRLSSLLNDLPHWSQLEGGWFIWLLLTCLFKYFSWRYHCPQWLQVKLPVVRNPIYLSQFFSLVSSRLGYTLSAACLLRLVAHLWVAFATNWIKWSCERPFIENERPIRINQTGVSYREIILGAYSPFERFWFFKLNSRKRTTNQNRSIEV